MNLAQRFRVFSSHGGLSRKSYLTKTPLFYGNEFIPTATLDSLLFLLLFFFLARVKHVIVEVSDVINLIRHYVARQRRERDLWGEGG